MDEEEKRVVEKSSKRKKKQKRKKTDPPKQLETLVPDPVTASTLDRLDAWKAAEKLLHEAKWGTGIEDEVVIILPSSVLDLANWLLYGPAGMSFADGGDD
ncbi:hypothetical protein [Streptomyces hydrogenans]|uniref:Uncharacterized protein n=1 Tax=Streptomyces hydrogenans TaxID=1873719 RepID=A0ABQ3PJF9_9ACTN|nr:hypothetical protein [Streptomyces hydrogenans]GHF94491.1 hypothetical protein GCM10018784_02700 [Streptomyces hydrogenans]GHI25144.1 hypothetical protein Shyd_65150 [Streptomyces hydrogenans]